MTCESLPPQRGGPRANGNFVYASNQGHDGIAAFAFDQATGELTPLEQEPSGGEGPDDFEVDIKGDFMIVANRGDAKVVALRIELDGTLTPLGSVDGPAGARAVQIRYQP
jgi:6-phosphogluconolactonase